MSRNRAKINFQYKLDNNISNHVETVTNLSVIIAAKLIFNDQLKYVVERFYKILAFLIRSWRVFKNTYVLY